MNFFKSTATKIGIDRSIAYTIFYRLIQAFGGVGTVIFIARFLSKEQQGYYYTFGSVIAIQIFFELGLSSIITQYVAHEMAGLHFETDGTLTGDPKNQSRVSSLLRFCIKWFSIIALVFFLVLLIVGFFFFTNFHDNAAVSWKGPWVILALATSGFLLFDPVLAFVEGLGKVKEIAKMRMVQQSVYVLSVITFLILGFNLYSSALATLLSFLSIAGMLLFSDKFYLLKTIWYLKSDWQVNYRQEIFPYQWKIALSWISGYFIFQLFNPVIFATEGPAAAGQMGITLAALNGVIGLSMSWINTKIPVFSGFIANRKYEELDKLFFRSFSQSLFITACGVCTLFILVSFLQAQNIQIGYRFLSSYPLAFMCLSFLLNNICFGLATYLRCHKKEPLLIQSIVFAILTALSTLVVGRAFGVFGITLGYLLLVGAIGVPWVYAVFHFKRKEWHQI
jgi:O-antigen/teichoic acid export membrane protein